MAGTLSLPTLVQRVLLDTKDVQKSAQGVEQSVGKASAAVGDLGDATENTAGRAKRGFSLSTGAVLAYTAAVVVGIRRSISTTRTYVGEVVKMSKVTGQSVEDASRLRFVLDRLRIDQGAASKGFVVLSKNIQQGGANFRQYFSSADLATLRTGDLSKAIPVLAREYKKLQTPMERTTFLQNTFGRGGLELRKLLELEAGEFATLAKQAEKFGLVLDNKNVAALKRYNLAATESAQATKGLELQVGLLTLPVMEKFHSVLAAVISRLATAPDWLQTTAAGAGLLAVGFGKLAPALDPFLNILGKARRFVTGFGEDAATAGKVAAPAIKAVGEAAATATGKLVGTGAASRLAAKGFVIVGEAGDDAAAGAVKVGAAAAAGTGAVEGLSAAAGGAAAGGLATFAIGLGIITAAAAATVFAIVVLRRRIDQLAKEGASAADRVARRGGSDPRAQLRAVEAELKRAKKREKDEARVASGPGSGDDFGFGPSRNKALQEASAAVDGLREKQKQLRAELRATGDTTKATAAETKDAKTEWDNFADSLGAVAFVADIESKAHDRLADALDGVGINTEAGIDAQARYAQTLVAAQVAAAGGTIEEKELNKIRGESAVAARKAAEEFAAAALKRAEAEDAATAKSIESNRRLIFSFDELGDKAKKGIRAFIDAVQGNAEVVDQFFTDANAIAAAGAPALAKALLEMGPEGARAARQAVNQIGSKEGLGRLEEIAFNAALVAKAKADEQLATWVPNFEGQGKAAVEGFRQGLTKFPEVQQELGKPTVLKIDTSGLEREMGVAIDSLNDYGLLAPIARLVADGSDASAEVLETERKLLGISKKQWQAIIRAVTEGIPGAETALNRTARDRTATIRVNAVTGGVVNKEGNRLIREEAERHGGGRIHTGGQVRRGAIRRMHFGGGLRPNEVPIIAERDEIMFSKRAVGYWGRDRLLAMNAKGNRMHGGGEVSGGGGRIDPRMIASAVAAGVAAALRALPRGGDVNINVPSTDPRVIVNEAIHQQARAAVR